MKKLALCLLLLSVMVCLASCIVATKTNEIISEVKPVHTDDIEENREDAVEEEPELVTVVLYFPDNDALYLHPESREISVYKDDNLANIVVEELFKGPQSPELSPCLDGEKLINSVTVSDGLCTVDFKGDFAILNSGGSARESFAVGSIVNSLCELEEIERVKINIDGDTNAAFGGHFTLEAPFSPQKDLIAR